MFLKKVHFSVICAKSYHRCYHSNCFQIRGLFDHNGNREVKFNTGSSLRVRGLSASKVNIAVKSRFFSWMESSINKSPNDKKQYRITKLENGLTCLLISDTDDKKTENDLNDDVQSTSESDSGHASDGEASVNDFESSDEEDDVTSKRGKEKKEKMAAAALCVGVGSFSDPENLPGLAHFLEHMLFMGSEKYPDENSFDSFISKHGGSDNAFTDCERTVFKMEVNPKYFKEALDRFAQFFISPLMKKDSMDREIKAVDSEFQLCLPKDSCRRMQIFGSLAKEGHPMSKFMGGNAETLKDIPSKENIDVREQLRLFRERYYSSHLMTLAVQSKASLDVLEEWVREIFSAIPNNGLPAADFSQCSDPFGTTKFNKLIKIVPVKKTNTLVISWSLPSLLSYYKCKPLDYIGWLVGHEGPGSIFSYLKKKVWALTVWAGNDDSGWDHNSTHSAFSVKVILTEKGMDHVDDVITCIFEYLELLRHEGPKERIFQEIKRINDNDFRWKDEVDPSDYVEMLAECMQRYPPEHFITGNYLLFEYNKEIIKQCQDSLVPSSANIIILSTKYQPMSEEFDTEVWTKAKYRIEDIPKDWTDKWKNLKPNPVFHLPEENKFIATDFHIKEPDVPQTEYPVRYFQDEQMRIFYKKDDKFNSPKACVYFHFVSPVVSASPQAVAMADLFCAVLKLSSLAEALYAATIASLSFELYPEARGIVVRISGFNHKLPLLLETILDYFLRLEVDAELFDSIKKHQSKHYFNSFIDPGKLCSDVRRSIVCQVHWMSLERRSVLKNITKDMLMSFIHQVMSQVYIEILAQGNITAKEAKEMALLMKSKLQTGPLPQELMPKVGLMEIPEGNYICRLATFNPKNCNSVITNYYQCGPGNLKEFCLMELMMLVMSEPCFDVLRTQEQLGYDVSCTHRNVYRILAYTISVHSPADKYSCSQVDFKIENFLKHFTKKIENATEEEFQTHLTSLIKIKSCPFLSLKEEAGKNWDEITLFNYEFDYIAQQIACLKKITRSEFKEWCLMHLPSEKEVKRSKISIQVVGNGEAALKECCSWIDKPVEQLPNHINSVSVPNVGEADDDNTVYTLQYFASTNEDRKQFVKDIFSFKQSLSCYPCIGICLNSEHGSD